MVDRNHAQLRPLEMTGDGNGGVVEGAVARIHRDGVVLAVGIAADVANDTEPPFRHGQGLKSGEGGSAVGAEVDAIDENVRLGDFREGPAALGLGHVPLQDVLFGDARRLAELDGAPTAPTESANDDDARMLPLVGLESGGQFRRYTLEKGGC